jgi:segregation and condensation protein B
VSDAQPNRIEAELAALPPSAEAAAPMPALPAVADLLAARELLEPSTSTSTSTTEAGEELEPKKSLVLPPGASLAGALEAVLLVANEPMSVGELMKVLEGATRAELNAAIRVLKERYAAGPSGFDLVEIAGGLRLLTRAEYAPWVERLEKVRREERLSRAQLEVLAVIAYRQPVLRADVDAVRGADSGGALRGLVDKGLVKVAGRADALGRPLLYGTTDRFLERFALKSVKELPRPKAEG